MNRIILSCAIALLGVATQLASAELFSPVPSIDGDTKFWAYDAAQSDEFDSAGAISASKWTEQLGEWKGRCCINCHGVLICAVARFSPSISSSSPLSILAFPPVFF